MIHHRPIARAALAARARIEAIVDGADERKLRRPS